MSFFKYGALGVEGPATGCVS
jgi:quercetin dioxygenase-like cupin family protein